MTALLLSSTASVITDRPPHPTGAAAGSAPRPVTKSPAKQLLTIYPSCGQQNPFKLEQNVTGTRATHRFIAVSYWDFHVYYDAPPYRELGAAPFPAPRAPRVAAPPVLSPATPRAVIWGGRGTVVRPRGVGWRSVSRGAYQNQLGF